MSVWIGADPGGEGNFGIAILRPDGTVTTRCVNCADEAISFIIQENVIPAGFGVDAPLWWSSGPSGGRLADQWIRGKYRLSGGQVQAVNSLRGAVLAQGMLFVQRVREYFTDANATETHPKAVLKALDQDELGFFRQYGVNTQAATEHERDAIVSAVAAREGFEGRWTNDLSVNRYPSEQDPTQHWLSPVHYFWPEI